MSEERDTPSVMPVTTSQMPPLRSRSMRMLSSFDDGFSSTSWCTGP